MSAKPLHEVQANPVPRLSWPFAEMNWAYGFPGEWGAPKGRISLWSGQAGVGKTRLLTQIMQYLAEDGKSSLIAQGEMSEDQFKNEKLSGISESLSRRIYLTSDMRLRSICSDIASIKPVVAFIDSVQTVRSERGRLRTPELIDALKRAIDKSGTHVVLISQLNKQGETSGTTELPHLVDVECFLRGFDKSELPYFFSFEVNKNRSGRSGGEIIFTHRNWGVECQSDERLKDKDWVAEHPNDAPDGSYQWPPQQKPKSLLGLLGSAIMGR